MDTFLERDLKEACEEQAEGWTRLGKIFVLERGDFRLKVHGVGPFGNSFIQISVTPNPCPHGTGVPFFRELSRHGIIRDTYGNQERLRIKAHQWVRVAIREALPWIAAKENS